MARGPRAYRLGQRQALVNETRARIIAATRGLLIAQGGFRGFTVDGVARQAGVSRMTVYYQFGSKLGLLEGLSDSIASSAGMTVERVSPIFKRAEPLEALAECTALFGQFWQSDRAVTRRFHGLAALAPDFAPVLRRRQERRRQGLQAIVGRLCAQHGQPSASDVESIV